MSDPDYLNIVHEKEKRVKELQRELDEAKEAYHQAIRQMHIGGKSLREIASSLNLSHQRVHQIVESENKGWCSWLRPAPPQLKCSFCDLGAKQVNKLVQGPNIFACDVCVLGCERAICLSTPVKAGRIEFRLLDVASKLRCSFCGKLPHYKRPVAAGGEHQICLQCIELSLEHMKVKRQDY